MSELQVKEEKPISQTLRLMINNAAMNLVEFLKNWEELKITGMDEGFSEKELQAMVVDAVRKVLKDEGFSNRQVTNKIFYLFNKADQKEKSLKIKTDYHNNDTEQSSSPSDWDKGSAMDEIARLHNENTELNNTLKNIGFSDNPEIFQINKKDENYFDNITPADALTLIKNSFSAEDLKNRSLIIEIAWRRK